MENINGALAFGSTLDNTDFNRKLAEMEAKIKGTTVTLQNEGGKWDGVVKSVAIGMAGAFTFQGANMFRQKLIDVRGEFQKYEAVLTNSLGSQKEASESMKMLSETASSTPFQLNSLTGAYVKLVNQGFKPTREEIIKLGDLASSTGKDFGQLAEAILDAQTGQFERLKEFGIKASASGDQIAFSFKGVTTTVQNSGTAIRDYMLSLGDLQGVKGSMEAISKTLQGQVSNLEDSITAMFNKMGTASEGFLSDSIAATKFLVDNYAEVAKILGVLVASYGSYKAAVILVTVLERAKAAAMLESALAGRALTTWEVLHSQALKSLQAAQMLLNRTMLANPYALVAAAIAGVVAYLILYNKKLTDAEKLEQRHNEIRKKFIDSLEEENVKTEALLATVNNEAIGKNKRLKALNDLKAASDGYLDGLTLENLKTAEGAGLLAGYNKELERKIYLQANQEEKVILIKEKRELEKQKKQIEKDIKDLEAQKYNPQLTQASSFAPAASTDVVETAVDQKLNKRTQLLEQQTLLTKKISELDKEQADLEAQSAKSISATGKAYGTVAAEIADIDTELKSLLSKKLALPVVDKKGITDINNQINALNARKKLLEDTGSSVPKDKPSDVTNAQKAEADLYNARVALHKAALDQMALTEKAFSDKVIALGGQARNANIAASTARFKAIQDAIADTVPLYNKLFEIEKEYTEKEAALKSANLKPEELSDRMENLKKLKSAELKSAIESSGAIIELGRNELKAKIENYEKQIKENEKLGKSSDTLKELLIAAQDQLNQSNLKIIANINQLAGAIGNLGSALSEYGGTAAQIGGILTGLAQSIGDISVAFDKTASNTDKAQAAINGIANLYSMVAGQIAANKQAQEDWNASIVESGQKAALARIELEAYKESNIFGVENPYAKVIAGVNEYAASMKELYDMTALLEAGAVQTGTEKKVSGENIAKGIGSGAAIGAAVGSVVPVIGNVVGAAIGAAVGGIVGLFTKKTVPVFESLKSQYGELFNKDTFELNPQILADYDKLDEATKKVVDNWGEIQDKALEAQQQMQDTFKALAGDIGSSLSDSLIEAFRNKDIYSAVDTFHNKVTSVIEDIIAQLVFSTYFQKMFDKLQANMSSSFDVGGDQSIVDDIIAFSNQYATAIPEYNKALQDVQTAMAKQGFDLFNTTGADAAKGLTNAIKSGVSEETASIVAGQLNAVRMNQAEGMSIMRNQLFHLANIDVNTFNLHSMSRDLSDIKRQIVTPNINMLP